MTPDEKVRLKNRTCRMWFSRATPLLPPVTTAGSIALGPSVSCRLVARDVLRRP